MISRSAQATGQVVGKISLRLAYLRNSYNPECTLRIFNLPTGIISSPKQIYTKILMVAFRQSQPKIHPFILKNFIILIINTFICW